ncbi:MAG: hypothetical protein H6570_09040 [Lewinellaceae bacterium]|nr:hypothetical protein [Lewinellaceae bacterium]
MKLHLVNGFLGSGKTTTIAAACVQLKEAGFRVAVITNDQGQDLVDTYYLRSLGITTNEVTGGCFCCHFSQLESSLLQFISNYDPEVIFAESVGSCTDLVATVAKPMLQKYPHLELTISTVTDASLMFKIIMDQASFLTEEIRYIFQKQIEEADILFLNKADLLSTSEHSSLINQTGLIYPEKLLMTGSARNPSDIASWLDYLPELSGTVTRQVLDVDYDRYAAGEAALGWLNVRIPIQDRQGRSMLIAEKVIITFYRKIIDQKLIIGHLKCLIDTGEATYKFNFTSSSSDYPAASTSEVIAVESTLTINARVACSPQQLQDLLLESLHFVKLEFAVAFTPGPIEAFAPAYPNPQFRLDH